MSFRFLEKFFQDASAPSSYRYSVQNYPHSVCAAILREGRPVGCISLELESRNKFLCPRVDEYCHDRDGEFTILHSGCSVTSVRNVN